MHSTTKRLVLFVAGIGLMALDAMAAKPAASKTVVLEVSGMHCAVCPITVRKALEAVPGVEKATVTLKPPQAVVIYDPAKVTTRQMVEAVHKSGYKARVADKQES